MLAEVPGRRVRVPGALPAKSVAEDQATRTADAQVLYHCLELKSLRCFAAGIAPREPQIAPDQLRPFVQIDGHPLIIAAALKWNGRAGQDHEHCTGRDMDLPLLRREAVQRRMDARRRLACDNGPRAGSGSDLHEL